MNNHKIVLKDCEEIVKRCANFPPCKVTDLHVQDSNLSYKPTGVVKLITITCEDTRDCALQVDCVAEISSTNSNRIAEEFFHFDFLSNLEKLCPNLRNNFVEKALLKTENYLIFENLEKQFSIRENLPLDVESVKTALEAIAQLHALSVLNRDENHLEKFQPDDVKQFKDELRCLQTIIKHFPPEIIQENDLIVKLGNSRIFSKISPESKQFSLLTHGNLSAKNVLFRVDNQNDQVYCKLCNFDQIKYRNPVYDVLEFIYSTTDSKTRQNNLERFLKIYYRTLQKQLKESQKNIDLDTIFSFEDYEVSIRNITPIVKLSNFTKMVVQKLPEICLESISNCLQDEHVRKVFMENFEELNDLVTHPDLLVEDCHKIIRVKLKTTDYELLRYDLKSPEIIQGYLGDPKLFDIEIKHENELKTLRLFAKFIPKGTIQLKLVKESLSFEKEFFFYRKFVEKVKSAGINLIDDVLAPCYFTRANDVLVFENMKVLGFTTISSRDPYDFKSLKLVVKQLAKLHSSSLLYEEIMSRKLGKTYRLTDEFGEELKEAYFLIGDRSCNKEIASGIAAIEKEIDIFPNFDSKLSQDDFKSKSKLAFKDFYELVKPSKKYRNAINQGDTWSTNILIKHLEGEPVDARVIDFQIIRYCPPSHDLLTALYLLTDRETRLKHLEELLELYHSEMAQIFGSFNVDIDDVYPHANFMESCEEMVPQAVVETILIYHLAMTVDEEMKEYRDEKLLEHILMVDRSQFIIDMCRKDELYRKRLGDSIQDLRDVCEKYY